jgi:hypothetical protein
VRDGAHSTEARDAVAAATAARWDTQGILATLADGDLDADPGGGEWTIRQTLAHSIGSQRGYAWGSAYWISVRNEPPAGGACARRASRPCPTSKTRRPLLPTCAKLDDVVDTTSSRYATLTADEMAVEAAGRASR